MPKYLFQLNYVGDGIKGLVKDGGSKRRAAAETLFKSMGATIEAFYYAFGDTDLYVIAEVPGNVDATAMALTVAATGALTSKTTVLLTPEEVDEAVKKHPSYRPPGQ